MKEQGVNCKSETLLTLRHPRKIKGMWENAIKVERDFNYLAKETKRV